MAKKLFSIAVMGVVSLFLFSILAFVTFGQSHPGSAWLWSSWIASLTLTAAVVWHARTARATLGYMSLLGGVVSVVILFAFLFVPVSASAPYQPGTDWLRTVDPSAPIDARLREAIASGYFAIAAIIAAAILLSFGYVLLHQSGGPGPTSHAP